MADKSQCTPLTESADSPVCGSVGQCAGCFAGTRNPRYLRVLDALAVRALSRNALDKVAGASNGPQLVSDLRALGLSLPCRRTPGRDRDGTPIHFGVYSLSTDDRSKIAEWRRRAGHTGREASDER